MSAAAPDTTHSLRVIDRRKPETIGHDTPQIRLRHRHGRHHTGRHLFHQPSAQRDDLERRVQIDHAGEARRGPFADAVTEERRRPHAPRDPQLGKRVLDDEQCRLCDARARQLLAMCVGRIRWIQHFAQIETQHAARASRHTRRRRPGTRAPLRRARGPC